jgi:hypothetical protein
MIKDIVLRDAIKQAEAAFRENNYLPIIEKGDSLSENSQPTVNAPTPNLNKTIPNTQKLKHFLFTDNTTLIQQIQNIYPDATNIIIINNDCRDGLGVPTMLTRQLQTRFANVSYSMGKRVLHSVGYNVLKVVICLVENNRVNAKAIINSELRELNY